MQRREAKALSLVRYFTGKPCKHGHISERHTVDGACLECSRLAANKSYHINAEKNRELAQRYRAENPEKVIAASRRYREKHREKRLASKREYWKQNPEKRAAAEQMKRARKRKALPSWFGEFDAFVWHEATILVKMREKFTGLKWHADHIIPMKAREASGLHVGNNCQVIPATLNIRKSNAMLFTTPGEWLFST